MRDMRPSRVLKKLREDMLFFEPGDFSLGIGAPGRWDPPGIARTRKRVAGDAGCEAAKAGRAVPCLDTASLLS